MHYLYDFAQDKNAVHEQHLDFLQKDLLFFELPSAANSEDKDKNIKNAINLIESNLMIKIDEFINFKFIEKFLSKMIKVELAFL